MRLERTAEPDWKDILKFALMALELSVDAYSTKSYLASAYLNCVGVIRYVGRPPEFTFFVILLSTERIARPRNQFLCCG